RAPCAHGMAKLHAVAGVAFAADHAADTVKLGSHALIGGDDLVEGVRDLADKAKLIAGKAYSEIAVTHRLEDAQKLARIERGLLEAAGDFRKDGDGGGRGASVTVRGGLT